MGRCKINAVPFIFYRTSTNEVCFPKWTLNWFNYSTHSDPLTTIIKKAIDIDLNMSWTLIVAYCLLLFIAVFPYSCWNFSTRSTVWNLLWIAIDEKDFHLIIGKMESYFLPCIYEIGIWKTPSVVITNFNKSGKYFFIVERVEKQLNCE